MTYNKPEITLNIESCDIVAKNRKLKVVWYYESDNLDCFLPTNWLSNIAAGQEICNCAEESIWEGIW